MKHFILTRFNIRLWNQDKFSQSVRSMDWLEQRFEVFEKFCLPSIVGQVCKDFEWIVLVDSMWKSPVCVTPEAQVPLTLESKFRMTPIKS